MNPGQIVDAEIVDPAWRFESAITTPNGVRIRAEVAVPDRLADADLGDITEFVQAAANTTLTNLRRSTGVTNL